MTDPAPDSDPGMRAVAAELAPTAGGRVVFDSPGHIVTGARP